MKPPLPDIPSDLRSLLAEVGRRWNVNRSDNIALMLERFTELLRGFPMDGITVRCDLAYGEHPRQQLDIYSPDENKNARAAVVFVHGGAFMDGHRNRTDRIYSNVPLYLAGNGVVGINIGYRLAGEVGYPGATEDVASAVAWTRRHAAELGIAPDRIFLMRHSARAAHAGSGACRQLRLR